MGEIWKSKVEYKKVQRVFQTKLIKTKIYAMEDDISAYKHTHTHANNNNKQTKIKLGHFKDNCDRL